jgi:hypothetical protein
VTQVETIAKYAARASFADLSAQSRKEDGPLPALFSWIWICRNEAAQWAKEHKMSDNFPEYPPRRETAIAGSETPAPAERLQFIGAPVREISFGPFRLLPAQFLLLEGDKPVPLKSRAMLILIVLLERPGELVTRQELMARVWPNLFVEPASLTDHISALRRALRDGRDGNRFIINVRGRGYCFVAPTR